MSKSWETTREPGFICFQMFGRIIKFTSGSRYMVNTDCRRQIHGADILLADLHQISDAGFLMFSCDSLIRSGSISKPMALDAVFFRRGHHDPAVAGAEIVNYVALLHLRHFEHPLHHFLRRGNVGNDLAFLRLDECSDLPPAAARLLTPPTKVIRHDFFISASW